MHWAKTATKFESHFCNVFNRGCYFLLTILLVLYSKFEEQKMCTYTCLHNEWNSNEYKLSYYRILMKLRIDLYVNAHGRDRRFQTILYVVHSNNALTGRELLTTTTRAEKTIYARLCIFFYCYFSLSCFVSSSVVILTPQQQLERAYAEKYYFTFVNHHTSP